MLKANLDQDVKDIVFLINICRQEETTILDSYTDEEERVFLKNLRPREAVLVARTDQDEFLGFASIMQRFESTRLSHCGETGTWVMPSFRRQGIGKSLWRKGIFPWCRKNGFKHLGFFVMANNKTALCFYENLGFHICGYHRKLILSNKSGYSDALEMELWID
ncbi:N-acetyltransferase family protein [Candidatus Hodarchaeum mangrovi]